MTTITIPVPDGDTCQGCDYKSHTGYENANRAYIESIYCTIFHCKIENQRKCVACRILAKMDGGKAI